MNIRLLKKELKENGITDVDVKRTTYGSIQIIYKDLDIYINDREDYFIKTDIFMDDIPITSDVFTEFDKSSFRPYEKIIDLIKKVKKQYPYLKQAMKIKDNLDNAMKN